MNLSFLDTIPERLRGNDRDLFGYPVNALALPAAGGVLNPTFTIQGDADFQCLVLNGTARDPAAPGTLFLNPPIMLEIHDGGSGRNLFSQPADWNTIVGDAQNPGELAYPKFFKRKGTVRVTVINNALLQAYDVRLTFIGFKIF